MSETDRANDDMKMPCEKIPKVGAWHDGQLPPPAAEAMAEHIASCPHCRAELERLRAISRWLRQADSPAPPDVLDRLRTQLAPRRERLILRLAGALTAAAAAVLIVCSVALWQRWSQVTSTAMLTDQTWAELAVSPPSEYPPDTHPDLPADLPDDSEVSAEVELIETLLGNETDGNQP